MEDFFEFYLFDFTGQEPPPHTSLFITEDGRQIITENLINNDVINIITEG